MSARSLPDIARRLGGKVYSGRILCPGPGHSAKDASLSVWLERDGGLHVHSFSGDQWTDCMDYVRSALNMPTFEPGKCRQTAAKDLRTPQERLAAALQAWEKDVADRRQDALSANRLWSRAVDPGGSIMVANYFSRRGLEPDEGMAGRLFRFLEDCNRGGEKAPALLVRFAPIVHPAEAVPWGEDPPVTCIQRIFLDPGKPKGHDGKWLMGHPFSLPKPFLHDGIVTTGPAEPLQAMKLTPDEEVSMGLHLSEGFETGLAAMMAGFRPLWATYSAEALARFPTLPGVEAVTILADHDQAGLTAAFACAQRWRDAAREAVIRFRSRPGADYADR
jgi:putative DNA primase/helicase